jgi:hypothetical protein
MVKKQKNFPKKHLFFVDILKATLVKRRIRGYGPLFRSADPDPYQNVTISEVLPFSREHTAEVPSNRKILYFLFNLL